MSKVARTPLDGLALALLLLVGLVLAWLTRDAPLVRVRGLLHADALSALVLIVAGAHGLVSVVLGRAHAQGTEVGRAAWQGWRLVAQAALVALAALMGHLGVAGALLVTSALLSRNRLGWAAALLAALGLALIGVLGGEWRHGQPLAGAGMNSASFVLLLLGALLSSGAAGLVLRRPPAIDPVLLLGCLYGLLRLFTLGPWNLGWLFAAMVLGAAVALWAGWASARAPDEELAAWLLVWLDGLAIAGAGLASGAGLTVVGYALLCGPVLRLGLANPRPGRALWLLCAATPLSAPFVLAWMAVAAALAGGVSVLAMLLWAAALLAALAPARLAWAAGQGAAEARDPAPPQPSRVPASLVGAALSGLLGLGAPLVVLGLLRAVVAQLQGGLTPFGAIELWPWAGLIARDAAQQPVATLPSLALAVLMLILCALCVVALRLRALARR